MDALRLAQEALNKADYIRNADRWDESRESASLYQATAAQAYAAIWQAEQVERIAGASERQAAAVERRNELLAELNEAAKESSATLQSSVMDLLNTVFSAAETEGE